jgi:EAL domain-containing protein (putative c-di-GMP-specific phosphodiesterase class I)
LLKSPEPIHSIAEDSGLIVEIGNSVLRKCCEQGARWRDAGHYDRVAVANVSALQFRRGPLENVVSKCLEDAGFEPGLL